MRVAPALPGVIFVWSSPRPISTSRLEPIARLPRLAYQPSVLAGGLTPRGVGDLILKRVSRLDGRTAQPLGPTPAPGCDEPTSRCQTIPSIWTLGEDQPVIPGVPFIR